MLCYVDEATIGICDISSVNDPTLVKCPMTEGRVASR